MDFFPPVFHLTAEPEVAEISEKGCLFEILNGFFSFHEMEEAERLDKLSEMWMVAPNPQTFQDFFAANAC